MRRKLRRAENQRNNRRCWRSWDGELGDLAPRAQDYSRGGKFSFLSAHIATLKAKSDLFTWSNQANKEDRIPYRCINKHRKELNIASLNLQGTSLGTEGIDAGKSEEIINLVDKHDIDILCVQENKRPLNDRFIKGNYTFLFASDYNNIRKPADNKDFLHKSKKIHKSIKGHGKGKRKIDQKDREHIWVGITYKTNEKRAESATNRLAAEKYI